MSSPSTSIIQVSVSVVAIEGETKIPGGTFAARNRRGNDPPRAVVYKRPQLLVTRCPPLSIAAERGGIVTCPAEPIATLPARSDGLTATTPFGYARIQMSPCFVAGSAGVAPGEIWYTDELAPPEPA